MPLDPLTLSAIIAGGSALAGTGANAVATGQMNRKSRQFSEKMYNRQFADNLRFWEMQNAYNHPKAAKERLKEAGLNPALLYGGSAAGAAGVASSVSAPSVVKPDFDIPNFSGIGDAGRGISSAIMARYDVAIKEKQAENLDKQNDLLLQQIKLAQVETNRKQFDLDLDSETRPTSVASREAQLRKLNADLAFTLDSNDRANIQNAVSVSEAVERILTARIGRDYTASLLKSESLKRRLMESDLDLRSKGISYSDPLWTRLLAKYVEELLPDVHDAAQSVVQPSAAKNFASGLFEGFKKSSSRIFERQREHFKSNFPKHYKK